MQSKGWIRLVAILLAIASLWQLSFTAVTAIQEKKAEKFAEKAAVAAMNTASFAKIPTEAQAYYLDSIRKDQNRVYIDSISSKKVYLWNTYKDCKAKEINLGLDLKGGMNVMLQVQLQDLVTALSGDSKSPEFLKALALAKERSVNSRDDFITLFGNAWKEVSNGQRLAQVFGTYEMKDKIKPESTDAEVLNVIRAESESAVANSFNVLRNRIDRFGVTQPSIQKADVSSSNFPVSRSLSVSGNSSRERLPSSSGRLSRTRRSPVILQRPTPSSQRSLPMSPRLPPRLPRLRP